MPSETATFPSTSCSRSSTIAASTTGNLRAHRRHGPGRLLLRPSWSPERSWRDEGFGLVAGAEDRLDRALSRIRRLDERGLEDYVARNDALRSHIGQATVVFASQA